MHCKHGFQWLNIFSEDKTNQYAKRCKFHNDGITIGYNNFSKYEVYKKNKIDKVEISKRLSVSDWINCKSLMLTEV